MLLGLWRVASVPGIDPQWRRFQPAVESRTWKEPPLTYRGLINFRDMGGHVTVDGSVMRAGLIYRSGRLDHLDQAHALRLVEKLGVRTVVDLRTDAERDKAGQSELSQWQQGLRQFHIPYFSALRPRPLGAVATDESWQPPELARRYVASTLQQGRYRLAELVQLLADPALGPTVVHCWSGKDRTGLVAAIIQSLVGVGDETVVRDFAATGEWFARHLPDHPELQAAPSVAAYRPAPEAMRLTLLGLRTQFGSLEQMLLESGALPGDIDRLRKRLLE